MRSLLILVVPLLVLLLVAVPARRPPLSSLGPSRPEDGRNAPAESPIKRPKSPPREFVKNVAVWPQLSPLYRSDPSGFFQPDCVTQFVGDQLAVAFTVDPAATPSAALPALNATLQALLLSLDVRQCDRVVLVPASAEAAWRTAVAAAGESDAAFRPLRVLGVPSVGEALRGPVTLPKHLTLVLPPHYPLDVELRMYILLQALRARPKLVLQSLAEVTISLAEAEDSVRTEAVLVSPALLPGRAVLLELPLMGQRGATVPPPLRWAAADRRGKHYSDKQRNECLMELLCRGKASNFWLCGAVHPLLRGDPVAYMESDCVSKYVADRLTVLITAHLAPSNPNPFLLRVLLQSLHLMPETRHVRKLIVYDGPPANQSARLAATIRNVRTLLASGSPVVQHVEVTQLPEQGKLRKTTEFGISQVKTPFVMIVQPDLPFLRAPALYYLLRSMEADAGLTYIRFNRSPNHQSKFDYWISSNVPKSSWVPLCRTPVFSSENHLVPTTLYTKVITPTMQAGKFTRWGLSHCRTVECLMNKRSNKTALFGTFIYGNIGDGPYSVHLDGSERHQRIPTELLDQL
eukprot:EG_transcript_5689